MVRPQRAAVPTFCFLHLYMVRCFITVDLGLGILYRVVAIGTGKNTKGSIAGWEGTRDYGHSVSYGRKAKGRENKGDHKTKPSAVLKFTEKAKK